MATATTPEERELVREQATWANGSAVFALDSKIRLRADAALRLLDERDKMAGELRAIRSTLAALLRVPEDSDTAAGFVARLVSDRGAVAAAYARDRAHQYTADSGSHAALLHLAAEFERREHLKAHEHGELDDLLAAPSAPSTQPEAPATARCAP